MADLLGLRLIGALLREKDFKHLVENHIDETDIKDDAREGLIWVRDFLTEKGEWPTALMLKESTGIALPESPDTLVYISDVVRQRSLAKGIEYHVKKVAHCIEERKPDDALAIMHAGSLALSIRSKKASTVSYRTGVGTRLERYIKLKSGELLRGIQTPWEKLNVNTQGWVNGTLNVILGQSNIGKSWMLCIIANDCLEKHKKVLFVSLEMDLARIQVRLDALRYRLPFGALRDARLDDAAEARYGTSLLVDKEGEGDILFADKKLVKTVHDVAYLVADFKPDIVLIDGGYRFSTLGGNMGEWGNAVTIINDLQMFAEATGVPWIVTSQYNMEKPSKTKETTKMHMGGARYAREWGINPDIVIGIHADEDLRLLRQLEIHTLKMRDTAGGTDIHPIFKINWDMARMNFDQIDVLGEGAKLGEDSEGVEYGVF